MKARTLKLTLQIGVNSESIFKQLNAQGFTYEPIEIKQLDNKLSEIKKSYQAGVLTDEEFRKKNQEINSRIHRHCSGFKFHPNYKKNEEQSN